MSMREITLKDWYEIQDIMSVQDEYTIFNLIDYFYGIDSTSLPLTELSKYDISFLNDFNNLDRVKLQDEYVINGTTYVGHTDLTKINVAQFIDFQNYVKVQPIRYEKVMSVFIMPKGCKYNEGYDMKKVQQDLLELPFIVVQKLAFFFEIQLQMFVKLFLFYLTQDLKKMDGEKAKQAAKLIEEMQAITTELCPTF